MARKNPQHPCEKGETGKNHDGKSGKTMTSKKWQSNPFSTFPLLF
jgi:hypothetical protein